MVFFFLLLVQLLVARPDDLLELVAPQVATLFPFLVDAHVLFGDALLLHPFPPLLLLAIFVPEAIEEDIFDLVSRVVLANHVQVSLGLVSGD